MFAIVSYVNLLFLLVVSLGHLGLSFVYYELCSASPSVSVTLFVTGVFGVLFSLIAAILYHCYSGDSSHRWNLVVTYALLVYLITTRIATTIVAFGLASDRRDKRRCTRLLYWGSTLLVLASLATLIVAVCLLGHVTLSQRQRGKSHRLLPATLQI